ncbi:hypothetical protein VNO77_16603 [Canavalia gladiata]|uniref:Uncharacterized protein n=1 Tax=Canavalia gladiata TaxID=3824 RepID=A0AAN9LHM0_CANGL
MDKTQRNRKYEIILQIYLYLTNIIYGVTSPATSEREGHVKSSNSSQRSRKRVSRWTTCTAFGNWVMNFVDTQKHQKITNG